MVRAEAFFFVPSLLLTFAFGTAFPAEGIQRSPEGAASIEALFGLRPGEILEGESLDVDKVGTFTAAARIRRTVGILGAVIRTVDRDSAGRIGAAPFEGVLVVSVEKESPAALTGLARDDVILLYGREPVLSVEQMADMVEGTPPGTEVVLGVLREGIRGEFAVTIGSGSSLTAKTMERTSPVLQDYRRTGMILAEIPPELGPLAERRYGARRGLVVTDLLPGGPAFFSALRRKDILAAAGGRPLEVLADYSAAVEGAVEKKEKSLEFVLLRRGQQVRTQVMLDENAASSSEFHYPLHLVSWIDSPERKTFHLFWGLLFRSERTHEIQGFDEQEIHLTNREWGLLLNFVNYSSRDGSRKLRFLWFIPFYSSSRRTLSPSL